MKTVLRILVVFVAIASCFAQDQSKKHEPATTARESATVVREGAARSAYRLDFKVYEIENGKRTNERAYTMMASVPGRWSHVNVGTRVPVATAPGEKSQYLNVGVELRCQLEEQAGKLFAHVRMELSSFALPEQSAGTSGSNLPVLRNTTSEVETGITPGKPQIVASADDVNSKKKLQLELTATRIE
jgi:hypothetical protein